MSLPNELLPVGLLGTGTGAGYEISRSLRFNSSDSAYLSRTPASAGNQRTYTVSFWCKRASLSSSQGLFSTDNASFTIKFVNTGSLFVQILVGASNVGWTTAALFRDPSAWYHVVVIVDTTQASSSNAVKLYVNGNLQALTFTAFSGSYTQNVNTGYNGTGAQSISRGFTGATFEYGNCYLADIYSIDGQALTPSSFTKVDATTGQLVPKAYSGTYGTNGFHLPFSDNSTAAALGTDTSGNGNNWTPVNLSVGPGGNTSQNWSVTASIAGPAGFEATKAFDGDASSSSSTYYFPDANGTGTFTFAQSVSYSTIKIWYGRNNGRLFVNGVDMAIGSTSYAELDQTYLASKGVTSPLTSIGLERVSTGNGAYLFGVEINGSQLIDPVYNAGNDSLVDTPTSYGTGSSGGDVRGNYATLNPLTSSAAFTLTNGNLDVSDTGAASPVLLGSIGVNSGKWYWEVTLGNPNAYVGAAQVTSRASVAYLGAASGQFIYNPAGVNSSFVNGVQYNYSTASTATTGDVIGVALDFDSNVITFYKNGVSQGAFSSNVLGTSTWAPAFKSNIASSAIFNFGQRPFAHPAPSGYKALVDTNLDAPVVAQPSTVMDVALDTGANILTATKALCGGNANFLWIKDRVNGSTNHHLIDIVRDPQLDGTPFLASNSISNETTLGTYSAPSGNSVGWAWYAGSSTVTNTDGSITSSVRANASAGFSIVQFTSQASGAATVGHGLGVAPQFIIQKIYNIANSWVVYHHSLGNTQYVYLNLTNAAAAASSTWNNTSPTSSVYSLGSDFAGGYSIISYCFAPVDGYSSFGSYTGNGSTDGPFVYTGFRPRWVLIKASSGISDGPWMLYDTARNTYNLSNNKLYANEASAENNSSGGDTSGTNGIDILSNGFKHRQANYYVNGSGNTYIYAAFAENPFQFSRAR